MVTSKEEIKKRIELLTGKTVQSMWPFQASLNGTDTEVVIGSKTDSGMEYAFFGDIYISLVASSTTPDTLKMYMGGTVNFQTSGNVNAGYTGLVNIPLAMYNIVFTGLALDNNAGARSYGLFTGWRFQLK